jgi:uncharacterized membrane protein YdbT with pleckstrin-like domain
LVISVMSTRRAVGAKSAKPNPGRSGPDNSEVVFTDSPNLRLFNLLYLIPLSAIAIGVTAYFLPIPGGVKVGVGAAAIYLGLIVPAQFFYYQLKLRRALYTVTTSYVESQTGILNRANRRIPLNQINDVTANQNFFQSLAGTHSITVTTSNGDSVVLESVTEGQRKQEIIWELVRGESPARLRIDINPSSKPTNG